MLKKHKFILSISLGLIVSFGVFSVASAQSQTLSTAQVNRIRVSCISAKNTVVQLQANDALLRINRGQLYEYMTTKLMSRFNSRAENNHLNAKSLVAVTNFYDNLLDTFRTDYQSYGEQLDKASNIDCVKDPVGFYHATLSARDKRKQVHDDVIRIHQNIGEYKSAFDAFVINFYRNKGAN